MLHYFELSYTVSNRKNYCLIICTSEKEITEDFIVNTVQQHEDNSFLKEDVSEIQILEISYYDFVVWKKPKIKTYTTKLAEASLEWEEKCLKKKMWEIA